MRKLHWVQSLAGDWPYWAGGIALALANTALMTIHGSPWGITLVLTHIGSRAAALFGGEPQAWAYYQDPVRAEALAAFGWWDSTLWLNLGIIAGVFLAGWAAGEWRPRAAPSRRSVGLALAGGLLLGYGSRLALGCNAGSLLGGIPSFSLHGWIFTGFTLAGVALGMKLFRRFL